MPTLLLQNFNQQGRHKRVLKGFPTPKFSLPAHLPSINSDHQTFALCLQTGPERSLFVGKLQLCTSPTIAFSFAPVNKCINIYIISFLCFSSFCGGIVSNVSVLLLVLRSVENGGGGGGDTGFLTICIR